MCRKFFFHNFVINTSHNAFKCFVSLLIPFSFIKIYHRERLSGSLGGYLRKKLLDGLFLFFVFTHLEYDIIRLPSEARVDYDHEA